MRLLQLRTTTRDDSLLSTAAPRAHTAQANNKHTILFSLPPRVVHHRTVASSPSPTFHDHQRVRAYKCMCNKIKSASKIFMNESNCFALFLFCLFRGSSSSFTLPCLCLYTSLIQLDFFPFFICITPGSRVCLLATSSRLHFTSPVRHRLLRSSSQQRLDCLFFLPSRYQSSCVSSSTYGAPKQNFIGRKKNDEIKIISFYNTAPGPSAR